MFPKMDGLMCAITGPFLKNPKLTKIITSQCHLPGEAPSPHLEVPQHQFDLIEGMVTLRKGTKKKKKSIRTKYRSDIKKKKKERKKKRKKRE